MDLLALTGTTFTPPIKLFPAYRNHARAAIHGGMLSARTAFLELVSAMYSMDTWRCDCAHGMLITMTKYAKDNLDARCHDLPRCARPSEH